MFLGFLCFCVTDCQKIKVANSRRGLSFLSVPFFLGIHSEKHKQFSLYWPHKGFFLGEKKATSREIRSSWIPLQHKKKEKKRKDWFEKGHLWDSNQLFQVYLCIELNFIYKYFILRCKSEEGPICISDLGHVLLRVNCFCVNKETEKEHRWLHLWRSLNYSWSFWCFLSSDGKVLTSSILLMVSISSETQTRSRIMDIYSN